MRLAQVGTFDQVKEHVLNQHRDLDYQDSDDVSYLSVADIEIPYIFLFTLNKEESKKKPNAKKYLRAKMSQATDKAQEQDMVMPGEDASEDVRKTIPRLSDNWCAQDDTLMAESNLADFDCLEGDELTYNQESHMYCLCFRFNQLLSTETIPEILPKVKLS